MHANASDFVFIHYKCSIISKVVILFPPIEIAHYLKDAMQSFIHYLKDAMQIKLL